MPVFHMVENPVDNRGKRCIRAGAERAGTATRAGEPFADRAVAGGVGKLLCSAPACAQVVRRSAPIRGPGGGLLLPCRARAESIEQSIQEPYHYESSPDRNERPRSIDRFDLLAEGEPFSGTGHADPTRLSIHILRPEIGGRHGELQPPVPPIARPIRQIPQQLRPYTPALGGRIHRDLFEPQAPRVTRSVSGVHEPVSQELSTRTFGDPGQVIVRSNLVIDRLGVDLGEDERRQASNSFPVGAPCRSDVDWINRRHDPLDRAGPRPAGTRRPGSARSYRMSEALSASSLRSPLISSTCAAIGSMRKRCTT